MSKFKVGDTFTIQIKRIRKDGAYVVGERVLAGAATSFAIPEYEMEELARYAVESKTYEDGLADAWEAVRKIEELWGDLADSELLCIFGIDDDDNRNESVMRTILSQKTPQEVIDSIKAYKDSREIRRGDEVICTNRYSWHYQRRGIVLQTGERKTMVIWEPCNADSARKSDLQMTGRNFADKLDSLLAEIGGDKNGED